MRILAVDHGSKRLGLAISDPTGTIANPLVVIPHTARVVDAASIAELAAVHEVVLIVVGQSFDEFGKPNFEGRRAARFAASVRAQTSIPVVMWDESLTTQSARAARIEMGVPRNKRMGHMDELAATILLQSYLDAHMRQGELN